MIFQIIMNGFTKNIDRIIRGKIESFIENYGLVRFIRQAGDEKPLNRSDALEYYREMKRSAD